MQWLLSELVMLAAPAYFFLQAIMAVRYRRRWRWLALVPLIFMLPLATQAGLAFAAGEPLWIVPLVLAAPVAFLYLLGLGVAKAVLA